VATNTAEVRPTNANQLQRCECKRHEACPRKVRPNRRFCSTCIEYCGAK
jgi:hypothetical protein